MFDLPQFVWLVLIIWAVWYGLRRLNRLPRGSGPGRAEAPPRPDTRRNARQDARPGPPPRLEAEDLVACRVCGTYVAAGAPDCGRRDCPRPR